MRRLAEVCSSAKESEEAAIEIGLQEKLKDFGEKPVKFAAGYNGWRTYAANTRWISSRP
jgi:hypothetical protein